VGSRSQSLAPPGKPIKGFAADPGARVGRGLHKVVRFVRIQ